MKELYHYHITIANCNTNALKHLSKSLNAKATTIDLYTDTNSQKDRMITKYGRTLTGITEIGKNDIAAIKLQGYEVVRFKIERIFDKLPDRIIGKYLEVHAKVLDTAGLVKYDKFALSKNPSEGGTRFYNCRIYENEELVYFTSTLAKIDTIEVQYESVIVDTNPLIDSWWSD